MSIHNQTLQAVPVDGEDKYSTVKSKTEPVNNEAVPVDVEALPVDGEDKYCTVRSETEPADNEALPVDSVTVPMD